MLKFKALFNIENIPLLYKKKRKVSKLRQTIELPGQPRRWAARNSGASRDPPYEWIPETIQRKDY